ncbi:MAG: hypothetical protein SXV54_27725, partial [Chloroflexota bacterium]|nr:hypothetical protein [Chloroflexota bacterium]
MKTHHWKAMFLATTTMVVVLVLASCATPTPEVREVETIVTQVVKETVQVEAVVTATPEPELEEEPLPDTPAGEYQNAGRHETVIFDVSVTHADPANWNPFIF